MRHAFRYQLGRAAVAAALAAGGLSLTPAPASALTPSTTTVTFTENVLPGNFNVGKVLCPAGQTAIGGGIDTANVLWMKVTSSAPTFGGTRLFLQTDGTGPAADGWQASARNDDGVAHTFKVSAICEPAGGSVGPTTSVITSVAIPTHTFGGTSALCPAGKTAVGGGFDLENVLTMTGSGTEPRMAAGFLSSVPDGAGGGAIGWLAFAINGEAVPKTIRVAALCADQTGLSPVTSVVGSATAATHDFATVAVTCPAGAEPVGGGIDPENVLSMQVTSSAETFAGTGRLLNQPDGNGTAGNGWQASAVNYDPATKSMKVAVLCIAPPPPPPPPGAKTVTRLSGADRILTAIAVSQDTFPAAASAGAVVLARGFDVFADALAGTPLAVAKHAPMLLTSSASLDSRTLAEIQRVLAPGKTVYMLGGPAALDPSIDAALSGAGYVVVRYAGADRFGTAVQIATNGLTNPPKILEATGLNFPDALAAGAAAAKIGAAILLTVDTAQAGPTADYLAAHPGDSRFAIGSQAATADPGATAVVGLDRYQTSAKVAAQFFTAPSVVAGALGTTFPDALPGGAHIGAKGGPLLLVLPSAPLPPDVQGYLSANHTTIASGYVYGGTSVLGEDVRTAISTVITSG